MNTTNEAGDLKAKAEEIRRGGVRWSKYERYAWILIGVGVAVSLYENYAETDVPYNNTAFFVGVGIYLVASNFRRNNRKEQIRMDKEIEELANREKTNPEKPEDRSLTEVTTISKKVSVTTKKDINKKKKIKSLKGD